MHRKVKLSIIIAMYNIEKYIAECVKSCRDQEMVSPNDYEVIIVNDGATDSSLKIANEEIKRTSNMRIVSRPNGGLSEARNTGLKEAHGEYIWFVDGDDKISSKSIFTILSAISKSNCDAYIINFSTFEDQAIISTSHFTNEAEIRSGKEYHNRQLRILPMMAWLTIYRKKVLQDNDLLFYPGILHEDMEFSIRAHHCCSSITFIEKDLYHYRIARTDSIMNESRRDNTKSLVSEIKIIDSFQYFFKKEDTPFTRKVLGMCATSFFIRRYDNAFSMNETTKELIKSNKKKLYKMMWKSKQWKRQLLLLFILIMPPFIIKKILYLIGERSKLM